jgi:hypothetical protein
MNPGTILCDNEFIFSDGSKGKKLLIVLNDGETGRYIIVKTTSKPVYKGITYGCQSEDRYPNFFLPEGSCCLHGQTWVMLDQFFEFSSTDLLSKSFAGQINRIGLLREEILIQLLKCAVGCQDITRKQSEALYAMLTKICPDDL